mgnify:CR=1 FL=1
MFNLISSLTNLPLKIKIFLLLFLDGFILALSSWLAFSIRLEEFDWFLNPNYSDLNKFILINVLVCIPLFWFFNLYKNVVRFFNFVSVYQVLQSLLIAFIIHYIIIIIVQPINFPRSYIFILFLISILFISIPRLLVGYFYNIVSIYNQTKQNSGLIKNILIYGIDENSKNLANVIINNSVHNLVGFIDNYNVSSKREILRKAIFSIDNIKDCVIKNNITDIFLVSYKNFNDSQNLLFKILENLNTRIIYIPNIDDFVSAKFQFNNIDNLSIDKLLGRDRIKPDLELIKKNVNDKKILITGAAGSIGSEICKILIKFQPKELILVDISETNLFYIEDNLNNLKNIYKLETNIIPILISITDIKKLDEIFKVYLPDTVYHAAAFKHVNLVEKNIHSALDNNFLGTMLVAANSIKYNVKKFVLISTDKAVNPINIMGATKRLSEIFIQSISKEDHINFSFLIEDETNFINSTVFTIVRFGNVLGSSGSVVPIFKNQIKNGGPITLTDKRVTRYFMNIEEAAELVIQAGGIIDDNYDNGQIFFLDMGEPIKIYKLAEMMIKYSGFTIKSSSNPLGDIEIKTIGLREGEKIHEELISFETSKKTKNRKIYILDETRIDWKILKNKIIKLNHYKSSSNILNLIKNILNNFNSEKKIIDTTILKKKSNMND